MKIYCQIHYGYYSAREKHLTVSLRIIIPRIIVQRFLKLLYLIYIYISVVRQQKEVFPPHFFIVKLEPETWLKTKTGE